MLDSKNKMGNIINSNIGTVSQTNIEKQEITTNQINVVIDGDFTKVAFSHELFPDYVVATKLMHNGKYTLVSKPMTENAIKNFPYNIKSSFQVIDERYKNIKDQEMLLDMLQYADSPVEVKITKFEQYLGNVLDPYPNPELSPMQEGTKTYIMPQKRELPKVEFKVDVEFEESTFKLRNINLKLTKQLSSKKFILDNYAQKSAPVFLQLVFEFISDKEMKCNLTYKANTEKLKDSKCVCIFNEFVLNLLTKRYSMYDRVKQMTIMSGKSNNECDEKNITELKDYIHLIKTIIKIEKYFNIKFDIPNKISKDDIDTIIALYKKIYESKKRVKAVDVRFSVIKKEADIERLKQLAKTKEISIITEYKDVVYNIFGIDIRIEKIKEKYDLIKCSNVSEVEEFINNYDLLDDKFELKIKMIPAKGKTFYKYTEIIKDKKLLNS